jgi:hypothetical protein
MNTIAMMSLLTFFLMLSSCEGNLIRPTPTHHAPGTPPFHQGVTSTTMPEPTSPATRKRFGSINEAVLFPRQAAETDICGYLEGEITNPLQCTSGRSCYYSVRGPGASFGPGCCSMTNGEYATSCGDTIATQCVDYGSAISSYLPANETKYLGAIFW